MEGEGNARGHSTETGSPRLQKLARHREREPPVLLQKDSNSKKTMEREAEETELLKEKRKENMTGRRSKDAQIRLERQS